MSVDWEEMRAISACPICARPYSADGVTLPRLCPCPHCISAAAARVVTAFPDEPPPEPCLMCVPQCPACNTLAPLQLPPKVTTPIEHSITTATAKQCDNCEPQLQQDATLSCDACNAYYCGACSGIVHAQRALQAHVPVPLAVARATAGSEPVQRCAQHDQQLQFYCITCNTSICHNCKDHGSHQGHEYDLLANRADAMRCELTRLCDRLDVRMTAALTEIRTNTATEAREAVKAHFSHLMQVPLLLLCL